MGVRCVCACVALLAAAVTSHDVPRKQHYGTGLSKNVRETGPPMFKVEASHTADVAAGDVIPHASVFINEAGNFDPESGVFTCPVSGVYSFQVKHFLSRKNRGKVPLVNLDEYEIHMDGDNIFSAEPAADSGQQGSEDAQQASELQTAPEPHWDDYKKASVFCAAGSRVWVACHVRAACPFVRKLATSFSGFLLYTLPPGERQGERRGRELH